MRLKLGRPDLSRYADRFDVPASEGGLGVTFLGVASLLLDDGTSAVMTDGFFSRPSLPRLLRPIAPDEARIDAALGRLGFGAGGRRRDAVAPVHTHYDHVMTRRWSRSAPARCSSVASRRPTSHAVPA